MKLHLIFALTSALAMCAGMTKDEIKKRAIDENWTFSYSEKKVHAKGLKKKKLVGVKHHVAKVGLTIPDKYDLRDTGDGGHRGLSRIMDQGQCGSCWAFSLTASLRDGWRLRGKDPLDLSEQYLVDCATTDAGCDGGYFDGANYLVNPLGSPSALSYPYTASNGTCKKPEPQIRASIVSWEMIENNPRAIESWILENHAPVSVTVAAGTGPWEMYDTGVYNGCTMGQTDHMINIVGWDNECGKFDANGNLPPGVGKWVLRNSWGLEWGLRGWMVSKMTDAQGQRCNNVAEEVAGMTYQGN